MVQNQIRSLFLLFAGEEELPDAVQPVLDEAVLEVQQALKDGADEDDARLNWRQRWRFSGTRRSPLPEIGQPALSPERSHRTQTLPRSWSLPACWYRHTAGCAGRCWKMKRFCFRRCRGFFCEVWFLGQSC